MIPNAEKFNSKRLSPMPCVRSDNSRSAWLLTKSLHILTRSWQRRMMVKEWKVMPARWSRGSMPASKCKSQDDFACYSNHGAGCRLYKDAMDDERNIPSANTYHFLSVCIICTLSPHMLVVFSSNGCCVSTSICYFANSCFGSTSDIHPEAKKVIRYRDNRTI